MNPRYLLLALTLTGLIEARNKIVIVSMSGLRHDYVDRSGLTTFEKFKAKGFHAKQMEIPFVTNSWPSLWTIATGLWPEEHGVIDDSMHDPMTTDSWKVGVNLIDTTWLPTKPIWITAEEDGVETAVSGWPGSTIKHGSTQASHSHPFVSAETPGATRDRIAEFASWMYEGADLGLISFPEPDNTAHITGADSDEVALAIRQCDTLLQYLIDTLKASNIYDTTNIIVVGDHGMADHDSDNVIYLSDFGVNIGDLNWITNNLFTTGMLLPHSNNVNSVYAKLKQPNATVNMVTYRKQDLPERFHIKNHRRTPPIVVVPDVGYRIEITRPHTDVRFESRLAGMHGYDNEEPDMKPAMLAMGPDINHKELDSFNSHDIYPMVCSMLKLKSCHGSDGTIDVPQQIVSATLTDTRPAKLDYKSLNTGARQKTSSSSFAVSVQPYQWSLLLLTLSALAVPFF